jgi:hypothetical protein
MLDAQIDVPAKLDLVVRTLRDLGDRELQRELFRGVNRVTEQLKQDARESALRKLPRRGGLAERVAGAKLSTRRRGGRNPGIRVTASGMGQLGALDRGQVRHPVYGDEPWVVQQVTPGWFSEPMEAGRDDVARALEELLDDLAAQLARKLG